MDSGGIEKTDARRKERKDALRNGEGRHGRET